MFAALRLLRHSDSIVMKREAGGRAKVRTCALTWEHAKCFLPVRTIIKNCRPRMARSND